MLKLLNYKLLDSDNCYIFTPDSQNLYANNTDFCILHINIRSLNKNFEKLEELLSVFSKMPEIIAIPETKLNSNLKTFLLGYTFIHNNSPTSAGGVRMFIKDTLSYKTTTKYQLNIIGCEEIWVKIQLNNKEKVFSGLYRHPNSKLSDFQSFFEKTIKILNKQKLIYYLCEDFNIDLLQRDTKTMVKNYSDILFSLGCLPLIKYPARIAHSSATLIDHFYSNNITKKTTSHILTEDISDHIPIVLLLFNIKHKTIEQNIVVRDTKNFNTENFLIELSENLNIFYDNYTVDEQFERFLDIFNTT